MTESTGRTNPNQEDRDRADAKRWAAAAEDLTFRAEMAEIAEIYDQPETWPT